MDPISIVTNIGKLALQIKAANETVHQNLEDCCNIARRVGIISDSLSRAPKRQSMCEALLILEQALENALNVITICQQKNIVSHFFRGNSLSRQLRDANNEIMCNIAVLELVKNLESTTYSKGGVQPSNSSQEEEGYYSCSARCSVAQLKAIVNKLSKKTLIEKSNHHSVHKVTLNDGVDAQVVARSYEQFAALGATFENEIRVMPKLEHMNVLKLLGYFSHGGFFYCVLEFVRGAALSGYIYGNKEGQKLSWNQCSKIIEMIAEGVVYLHEHHIVHMNLCPSNIRKGNQKIPKICNFSSSVILPHSQEGRVISHKIARGFAPPEYVFDRRFSVKTDVYSYGVLLLEFLSGQRCKQENNRFNPLTARVLQLKRENKLTKCIDPRLIKAADVSAPQIEDIKRCFDIALLCVEEDPTLRPTMPNVLSWLRKRNKNFREPQQPAYSYDKEVHYPLKRHEEKEGHYYSCSSRCSVSQMKDITNKLSEENLISKNKYLTNYKVTLSNGVQAYVEERSGEQFRAVAALIENEIRVRPHLGHTNILKLFGYFTHRGYYYLVQERMLECLSGYIYGKYLPSNDGRYMPSWRWCSNIIGKIAEAIRYLHEHRIVHINLRPKKIGFDGKGILKIGGFYMSEMLPQSQEEGIATSSSKMARGFAPPEYVYDGRFTVKTDVYSYGIILLELITGRRCDQGDDNYNSLTASVWHYMRKDNMEGCIHQRLINAADVSEPQIVDIKRWIQIALLCVEEDPALRPTMPTVFFWLRNRNKVLPVPQQPAYSYRKEPPYSVNSYEVQEGYTPCSSRCSALQLKAIINNLSKETFIGQNEYCDRHKVTLKDGFQAYVEVRNDKQFSAEAAALENQIRVRPQLDHINILKLFGYYSHGGFFYFVQERIHECLSNYIYDNRPRGFKLSWRWCSNTIEKIAEGVVYLHEHNIIHRHLRPSNIGFDGEGNPKICIFGETGTLPREARDTSFKMRRGFAPPEYVRDGRFSNKTDVYSYGVLLLELISGRRCNQENDSFNPLTAWVWRLAHENRMIDCIDPWLIKDAPPQTIEDIKRCIRIALLCVEDDPAQRPNMPAILRRLQNKNKEIERSKQPAYITRRDGEK